MGGLGDCVMRVKRLFDIVVSSLALIVLLLPILALTWITYCKIGSPVFFRQRRAGMYGKPFMLVKFRTMTSERSPDGRLLHDALRLTNYGKFLRRTSLDELPQLWNVLRGDMSIVGPRPLLIEYLPLYTKAQARRHEVRPGITGLAQLNGRNAISWEDRFDYDVWYVDNHNQWFDIKLCLQSVKKVLLREGIYPEGEMGMPKFTGSIKE
jgi:lipopolysaccharide/colanic/teichoic acid biosynthesis glycosyltransferase